MIDEQKPDLIVCAETMDLSKAPVYVKFVPVRAHQMQLAFWIKNEQGQQITGRRGDWIVEGPTGKRWIVPDELFRQIYFPEGNISITITPTEPPVENKPSA